MNTNLALSMLHMFPSIVIIIITEYDVLKEGIVNELY